MMNIKEMTEKALTLGKRGVQTVKENGKNYLLCGTYLAYEDELCDRVYETFKMLGEIFNIEVKWDDFCDDISEVRDLFLQRFEERTNSEIIIGSTEY